MFIYMYSDQPELGNSRTCGHGTRVHMKVSPSIAQVKKPNPNPLIRSSLARQRLRSREPPTSPSWEARGPKKTNK